MPELQHSPTSLSRCCTCPDPFPRGKGAERGSAVVVNASPVFGLTAAIVRTTFCIGAATTVVSTATATILVKAAATVVTIIAATGVTAPVVVADIVTSVLTAAAILTAGLILVEAPALVSIALPLLCIGILAR